MNFQMIVGTIRSFFWSELTNEKVNLLKLIASERHQHERFSVPAVHVLFNYWLMKISLCAERERKLLKSQLEFVEVGKNFICKLKFSFCRHAFIHGWVVLFGGEFNLIYLSQVCFRLVVNSTINNFFTWFLNLLLWLLFRRLKLFDVALAQFFPFDKFLLPSRFIHFQHHLIVRTFFIHKSLFII